MKFKVMKEGYAMPYNEVATILISKKVREKVGLKAGSIVWVIRGNYEALAMVGKQFKELKNMGEGCVLNKRLVRALPCIPDDEIKIKEVGKEMYLEPEITESDELKGVERLISPQEIAWLIVLGYHGVMMKKALSLQMASVRFTNNTKQALREFTDFNVITGKVVERYSKECEESKTICRITNPKGKIVVGYKPTSKGKEKKKKWQVYISHTKKRIHCNTLKEALDKTLKEAGMVLAI